MATGNLVVLQLNFRPNDMATAPGDLLRLSEELLTSDADEVRRRCVISRAYYAALHATGATFSAPVNEVRNPNESSHSRIINRAVAYGAAAKPGRSAASEIAKILPRIRRVRNKADYELDTVVEPDDCTQLTVRVKKVLSLCADVERLRKTAEKAA